MKKTIIACTLMLCATTLINSTILTGALICLGSNAWHDMMGNFWGVLQHLKLDIIFIIASSLGILGIVIMFLDLIFSIKKS